jgi:transcription antitermination protein NusB
MAHLKTQGRELALQYLYMVDALSGQDVYSFADWAAQQQPAPEREAVEFARELADSVLEHREEIDAEISGVAANWNIERMATVDRNVLRLGLAELMRYPETSHKIVINEAVELAKRFSSEDAGSFVNGLLDKLRVKIRPQTQG